MKMNTLLDIGPLYEVVMIRGKPVKVTGLTAIDIFDLLVRFPEIRRLFDQQDDNAATWNTDNLIKTAPRVVYAGVAICTGSPGDDDAEKVMSELSVAEQVKLTSVALRLTFPEGVGPFTAEFREMTGKLSAEAEDSENPSPTASLASLQVDMPPLKKRGSTRHVN